MSIPWFLSLHLQFIWQFNEDSWFRLIKMFSYFLFYPNTLVFFCIAIFIRQRRLYCQTEDLFIFHKIGDKRNRFIFHSQSFLTVIKFFTGSNIGFQKCYSDHLSPLFWILNAWFMGNLVCIYILNTDCLLRTLYKL